MSQEGMWSKRKGASCGSQHRSSTHIYPPGCWGQPAADEHVPWSLSGGVSSHYGGNRNHTVFYLRITGFSSVSAVLGSSAASDPEVPAQSESILMVLLDLSQVLRDTFSLLPVELKPSVPMEASTTMLLCTRSIHLNVTIQSSPGGSPDTDPAKTQPFSQNAQQTLVFPAPPRDCIRPLTVWCWALQLTDLAKVDYKFRSAGSVAPNWWTWRGNTMRWLPLHLSPRGPQSKSKTTEYVKGTGICSTLMFGMFGPFKYLTLWDGVLLINDLFIHERD